MRRPRALAVLLTIAGSVAFSACGQGISVDDGAADINAGAKLFATRCQGCHTLDSVGASGGALKVNDRERVDGPNFNVRKECVDEVLQAIRNGGFSGAIMPENIVVGTEAQQVAEFLEQYSGLKASKASGASKPLTCE